MVQNYKTTSITLKIRPRFTNGPGTDLKLIKGDIYRETAFNGSVTLSFSTVNPQMLKKTQQDTGYLNENPGYALIENENEILLDGHIYKIKQITDRGTYKRITCTHQFDELAKVQRYDYIEGVVTIGVVIDYLFAGTGWNVNIEPYVRDVPVSFPKQKFGVGSVLKVFKELLKRMPIEYLLKPNKTIDISFGIGGNTKVPLAYGVHLKTLAVESDSTDLYTRIRGFYANVVGQDENGDDIIDGWNYVDVINEAFEEEYGVLEMDSLWESNITNASEMEFACWVKLYSEIKYNVDVTAADFDVQHVGQFVEFTHPTIDTSAFDYSARVLSVKEGLINNELKPVEVTVGNHFFDYQEQMTQERLDNIENDLRNLKNRTSNFMLSRFNVGDKSALALPGVLLGANVQLPQDIVAELEYEQPEELTGLFLRLKTAYENFYIEVKTYNKAGAVTGTYDYKTLMATIEQWKLPNDNVQSVSVHITQVPPDTFDPAQHKHQILAFRFKRKGDFVDYWLDEFTIGGVDMLAVGADDVTQQAIEHAKNPSKTILSGAIYNTETRIKGVTVKVKKEYANYHVYLFATAVANGKSTTEIIPVADIAGFLADMEIPMVGTEMHIGVIVSEKPILDNLTDDMLIQAIGVHVEMPEPTTEHWLSEFRIGDVDALAIPGVLMDSDNPNAIVAEIEYTKIEELKGVFLNLKPEYAAYSVTIRDIGKSGSIYDYSFEEHGNDLSNWAYPLDGFDRFMIIVTNGATAQYYGVRFVKDNTPSPEPTGGAYRNIFTYPYYTSRDEMSGSYFSMLSFSHKDAERSGEILGAIERELLTGLTYVTLENYSGGTIKFIAKLVPFGDAESGSVESVEIVVELGSGTFTLPLHYCLHAEYTGEHRIFLELFKLSGEVSSVQFQNGSLSGIIDYISYTLS